MGRFSSYSYGEGRTGLGQLVNFSLPSKNRERNTRIIKAVLRRLVRHVDVYATKKVHNIEHGSYGRYTRYDMVRREYAGGRGGYIEVLEISNPPDERARYVIYDYRTDGRSSFSEWETLESARQAWDHYWRNVHNVQLSKQPGFRRLVQCGIFTPWFYAVGDEALVGDYAFPHGLQDDPVFGFGKRFVVTDRNGYIAIKTCLGCRLTNHTEEYSSVRWSRDKRQIMRRVVYWDDGTIWSEIVGEQAFLAPRPLYDEELWVIEAMEQFRLLLSGQVTDFSIPFIGGQKFIGKLVADKTRTHQQEGRYSAVVTIEGRSKPAQGWFDFIPTLDIPDAVTYIQKQMRLQSGEKITRIEINDYQLPDASKEKKRRRWSGVFFRSPLEKES